MGALGAYRSEPAADLAGHPLDGDAEDAVIRRMELKRALELLTPQQRVAMVKRYRGDVLTPAERKALERARRTVTKWLK